MDRSVLILQGLVAIDPGNPGWVSDLAHKKVVAGTLRQGQHSQGDGASMAASGIASLRAYALPDDSSIPTLDHATSALLIVLPAKLRNPELAIQFGERLVTMSHRRKPTFLLSLAQAYRAAGRLEEARAVAREGLGLLPPLRPGATRPRLRVLLEAELDASRRT
jgi:hypothetical protein